jgi:hypothetical protein
LLLPVIIEHLHASSRARTHVDRVRSSNVAQRLLKGVPRKQAPEPKPFTMQDVERLARGKA